MMKAKCVGQRRLPFALALFLNPLVRDLPAAPLSPAEAEMEGLVARALENNPRLLAARSRLAAAQADRRGVAGFFDPRLTASGGRTGWTRAVPGASRGTGLENNAVVGKFGLEVPVRPGAYASVGLAERYLTEPSEDYDALYQSLLGAQLWVPLARDRGFAEWRARGDGASAAEDTAGHEVTAAAQEVRLDVGRTYLDALRSLADLDEIRASTERVRKLLEETETLVRLEAVPQYQIAPTRYEVALREEEERIARHTFQSLCIRLGELVGLTNAVTLNASADVLSAWAEASPVPPARADLAEACGRRGAFLAAVGRVRAAEAQRRLADEAVKPDVALAASASWQAENPDDALGTEVALEDEEVGTEVALVWTQPLGFRAERAAAEASRADAQARREEVEGLRLQVAAELDTARDAWATAKQRLGLAQEAVAQATLVLQGEAERFRLGDGRSRNVLDAQEDLKAAGLRRNLAAAALLLARLDYLYATGYGPEASGTEDSHDAEAVEDPDGSDPGGIR